MMTNGPAATIGEVLRVDLRAAARPRRAWSRTGRYTHFRKAVLDFLYTRRQHVEKAAEPPPGRPRSPARAAAQPGGSHRREHGGFRVKTFIRAGRGLGA